jgi:hypothetical protein
MVYIVTTKVERVSWLALGEENGKKNIFRQMLFIKHRSGPAMAQAVSRLPLTTEARIHARVCPCEICGGQSDTGTGFSPLY